MDERACREMQGNAQAHTAREHELPRAGQGGPGGGDERTCREMRRRTRSRREVHGRAAGGGRGVLLSCFQASRDVINTESIT